MKRRKIQPNIKPINDAGRRHLALADAKLRHQRKQVGLRWCCGIWMGMMIFMAISQGITHHRQAQIAHASQAEIAKKLAAAKERQGELKKTIHNLEDERYLQKLVRERYMYSKDSEIVFNLPDGV